MIEVGAARIQKDGGIRAVSRRYTSGGAEPAAIQHLGSTGRDLFNTLEHNLASAPAARLFDDSVVSVKMDRAALPLFRRLLRQRGSAFLEDVEGWISEHERPESPDAVRAGIIVQMFVDPEPELQEDLTGPRAV